MFNIYRPHRNDTLRDTIDESSCIIAESKLYPLESWQLVLSSHHHRNSDDARKRHLTNVLLKPLKMYYYLSFLRPPPTTVDLASPFASNWITITPQIANDLRTELLDDRPTEIWYTWNQVSSASSSKSNKTNTRSCQTTPAAKLTTYEPPSSTYKPILVPLPPKCRAGEIWTLSLFCPAEGSTEEGRGTEGMIPLRKGEIIGVQSMGIEFSSSSSSVPVNSSARAGPSSKPSTSRNTGKSGSTAIPTNGKKSSGSKPVEGPKQTRIMRSWLVPPGGLVDAREAGSSSVGRPRVDEKDRSASVGDITSVEEVEKGTDGRRSIKRDSEGVPIVRLPDVLNGSGRGLERENLKVDTGEEGAGESDLNGGDEQKVQEERHLRVIEETSFDLDKKIWDSGLALTSYLLTLASPHSETPQAGLRPTFPPPADLMDRLSKPNSRILEIGAGTGLVGIGMAGSGVALGSGSRVMITDLPSAIPLIDENIELNRNLWEASRGVTVQSGVLDWDEDVPDWVWSWASEEGDEKKAGLDVVLAADVTYNTATFPALVSTLKRLFTPSSPTTPPPLLLLAYKQRHASERTLWPALQAIGIELERFGSIPGHEADLDVDVITGRDEEQGEEVRSGMGATELWVGRKV